MEQIENQELNTVTPEINEETIPVSEQDEQKQELDEVKPETDEAKQSAGESCVGIVERLAAVEEELKRSNQLFESKILYDATKEEMINKLHGKLKKYEDDVLRKTLKPIFMDMIIFADNMRSLVSRYEETPEQEVLLEKYQKLRKEFLKIGSHIDDLLYNYGIESYSANVGDEFNPRTQQAKKSTDIDNPDEHKKIVASMSAGYMWDEQLLRRESVHISTHKTVNDN